MNRLSSVVFLVFVFAACSRQPVAATQIKVVGGSIELRNFDFELQGPVELDGEWEYYPGKLIDPMDLNKSAAPKQLATVPQSFNSYKDPRLNLPAAANATYRVMLHLPEKMRNYIIRIPPPATASRVFINGHKEFDTGLVAENANDVVAKNRVRYFQGPLAGNTEFVVQVSNAKNRKGGIWQGITVGDDSTMTSRRLQSVAVDVAITAALITFALYHIALALLRNPESSLIYYGVFCLLVGGRRLFTSEQLIADFLPSLSWEAHITFEYFTYFAGAAVFQMYLLRFFKVLQEQLLARIFVGVSAGFAFLSLILPVTLSKHLLIPFQIYFFLVCLYTFLQVLGLMKRRTFGAGTFALGLLILTVALTNDVLVNAEIYRAPFLMSYAIIVFIFIQAFMISGKSLLIFRENSEMSQQLLKSDKLRDDFLNQTSLELRTPVQAMVQTAENLRRGLSGAVSEQVQKALSIMEENGRRLLYLLDDLVDFIRLKHSNVILDIQRVQLKKILSPVLQLCLGLSENKQLVLIDEIPQGLADVEVDPARLQQLILNLLNAAMRHSHSPAITLKVGRLENQLAISVLYHGGEPDAFFTTASGDDEHDLGPRVPQRIAELMGGKYVYQKYAESQHALTITIPYTHLEDLDALLAQTHHRTEYRKGTERGATNMPMARGAPASTETEILIIGENASQNRLLQEQLVILGKQAIVAKNGAEAMMMLQSHRDMALVICDVLLPDVSGIELAMNIRVHYDIGLLPIILIIDSNQAGIAASAFSAGVNDLIRRPFERAEVIARVKNVLLQREASLARENYRSLNRELEIARSIQEAIIPVSKPRNNLYNIEAVCMPARSIGGDFYDFIEDENSVAVLIADVAGHGIPAALYASMLKIAFHNLRDQARFPEKLLRELNDIMIDRGERTFISCAYTFVDFKNKRLLHANAGHLPLLLQEPGKKAVRKLHPPGSVLGLRKAAEISVEMRHLQPKTRLFLFTDGVIELANRRGELFEEERLIGILEEMRDQPLLAVKERLLASLREFAEGEAFLDDVTFVLMDV